MDREPDKTVTGDRTDNSRQPRAKTTRWQPVADDNKEKARDKRSPDVDVEAPSTKVKFEIYGEEMIEKKVKSSGNSGRVYLPPNWVGHNVKIIRID